MKPRLLRVTKEGENFVDLTRTEFKIFAGKLSAALCKESAKGRLETTEVKGIQYLNNRAIMSVWNDATLSWIKDKVPQIMKGYLASGSNEGSNLIRYGTFIKEHTSALGPVEIGAAIHGRIRAVDKKALITPMGRPQRTRDRPGEVFWRFGINKEAEDVLASKHFRLPVGTDECFFFPLKSKKRQLKPDDLDRELLATVTEETGTQEEPVTLE